MRQPSAAPCLSVPAWCSTGPFPPVRLFWWSGCCRRSTPGRCCTRPRLSTPTTPRDQRHSKAMISIWNERWLIKPNDPFHYLIVPLSHSQVASKLKDSLLLQRVVCVESSTLTKPLQRKEKTLLKHFMETFESDLPWLLQHNASFTCTVAQICEAILKKQNILHDTKCNLK